jgi:hypothetical protein
VANHPAAADLRPLSRNVRRLNHLVDGNLMAFLPSLLLSIALSGPVQPCAALCLCELRVAGHPEPTVEMRVQRARDAAAAVFSGRVVRIDTLTRRPFTGGDPSPDVRRGLPASVRFHFAVQAAWKGDVLDTASVVVNEVYSSCGRWFEVGEGYVIYASGAKGGLTAGACTRTVPMSMAEEDLQLLGPPPVLFPASSAAEPAVVGDAGPGIL